MTKFSSLLAVLLLMLASFTTNAQGYPRGDVDRDGAVTISDVTCLIDNLLKGVPEGDVDQDGSVNISDVTSLIDYLLKGSWPDDPVTPPDEGDWVDLGLPSGTLWATRNVGASCPEDYGDYFAWGETEPKEVYTLFNYKWYESGYVDGSLESGYTKYVWIRESGYDGFADGKIKLDPEDDAAFVNWGPLWRTPSKDQICELYNKCSWKWTQYNDVYGRLFTGSNGNTIFLPATGWRTNDELRKAGSEGRYWSCDGFWDSPYTISSSDAYALLFRSNETFYHWYSRIIGLTVRAVRVSQN